MDKRYYSVQQRSARQIENLARDLRRELGIEPDARISMTPILEFALEEIVDDAVFTVVDDQELDGAEGRTDMYEPRITLAASTYVKLRKGDSRARMTAAHELGHLLLHSRRPIFHYRARSKNRTVDPEWQADMFAAALLMPASAFRKMKTVSQARKTFGVSKGAALRRARELSVRLIDDFANSSNFKRKGRSPVNRAP
jgi:hypothetical protein